MSTQPLQSEQTTAMRTAPVWRRYLAWLAAAALVLYPLPFLLMRAPHFERWSTSPYGRDLEYGMTARGVNADVLIYGDSTALYGLDPRQMSQELGVKVFNLPNLLPSLRVTGDLGLRRYLAANQRPRLIVFYLSAWDLDYAASKSRDILYDGDEMLLRHGSAGEIFSFYKSHASELLQFPFMFYRVNSPLGLQYLLEPRPDPLSAGSLGHLVLMTGNPLPPACSLPPVKTSLETARALVARYNTRGTRAIVYVAPLPGCRNAAALRVKNYSALQAESPRLLPPGDFLADGYYAHPSATHVGEVTDQLAEALRARMGALR